MDEKLIPTNISFSRLQHVGLGLRAKKDSVSKAEVIRRAVNDYLKDDLNGQEIEQQIVDAPVQDTVVFAEPQTETEKDLIQVVTSGWTPDLIGKFFPFFRKKQP